jgi:antiviral helicase SLH1
MSPAAESTESQWLAQLAAMREAIAGLKLNQSNGNVQEYGHDLLVEDEDLTGDSGNDDIWDVFSEDEGCEYSSDLLDEEDGTLLEEETFGDKNGQDWLRNKCVAFTSGKSGFDASELHEQLLALLVSDMQGMLTLMV